MEGSVGRAIEKRTVVENYTIEIETPIDFYVKHRRMRRGWNCWNEQQRNNWRKIHIPKKNQSDTEDSHSWSHWGEIGPDRSEIGRQNWFSVETTAFIGGFGPNNAERSGWLGVVFITVTHNVVHKGICSQGLDWDLFAEHGHLRIADWIFLETSAFATFSSPVFHTHWYCRYESADW